MSWMEITTRWCGLLRSQGSKVGVEIIPGQTLHWAEDRGVISEKGGHVGFGLGLASSLGRLACVCGFVAVEMAGGLAGRSLHTQSTAHRL